VAATKVPERDTVLIAIYLAFIAGAAVLWFVGPWWLLEVLAFCAVVATLAASRRKRRRAAAADPWTHDDRDGMVQAGHAPMGWRQGKWHVATVARWLMGIGFILTVVMTAASDAANDFPGWPVYVSMAMLLVGLLLSQAYDPMARGRGSPRPL